MRLFLTLLALASLTSAADARTIHLSGGTGPELALFLTIVGTIILSAVATYVVRIMRR